MRLHRRSGEPRDGAPTQRHRELVADLAPECTALREAQMMRIRGTATANQTGLLGHISDVIAVPDAARLRQAQRCSYRFPLLVSCLGSSAGRDAGGRDACSSSPLLFQAGLQPGTAKLVIFAWKASSTRWASAARQLVLLGRIDAPRARRHRRSQIIEFGNKPIAQFCRGFRFKHLAQRNANTPR